MTKTDQQDEGKDGKQRNFTCDRCRKKFFTKQHRDDHIDQVHDRNKRYTCQECGISSYTQTTLKRHLQVHKNPNKRDKFQCKKCNKSYITSSGLAGHVRKRHERPQKLVCSWPGCHHTAACKSHLKTHIDSVHKNLYQYPCPLKKQNGRGCSKVFKSKSVANTHFRNVHLKRRFPCSLASCNETFTKRDTARVHYRRVHEGDSVRWRCPHCSKLLSDSYNLLRHIAMVHQTRSDESNRRWLHRRATNGSLK